MNKVLIFLFMLGFGLPGCAETLPEKGHAAATDQAVQVYDEIMSRPGLHSKVPEGLAGRKRQAIHFHHTYGEMSRGFAEILKTQSDLSEQDRKSLSELANITKEMADTYDTIAGKEIENIDSPEYDHVRMMNRKLTSAIDAMR